MNNKFLFLLILLVGVSSFAFGDMIAMIAKDGYTISDQGEHTSSFNDPVDYFKFMMQMSDDYYIYPPYLSGLQGQNANRVENYDGYGLVFYRDGSRLLDPNEYYVSNYNAQLFYQRGEGTCYPDTVWNPSGGGRALSFAYARILNEFSTTLPGDFDNETATIVMGHDRHATVGDGNHPYTILDTLFNEDITYSMMGTGTLYASCYVNMRTFLYNQGWWTDHHPNNYTNYTNCSDTEILFHYLMYFIQEHDGDVAEGIISAINQTDINGADIRNMLMNPVEYSEDFWKNVANFVFSDGESLYLFTNASPYDLRHELSYKDVGEFYAVKTLAPEGGTLVDQFDLVKLSPDHAPEVYENVFDMQVVIEPGMSTVNSRFGYTVDVDGDFAVVGAPYDNHNGSTSAAGAAYVYKKNASDDWVLFQTLTLNNPSTYDKFGYSVAIDDDYIVVGCPGEDDGTTSNCGAVYRYKYNSLFNSWLTDQHAMGNNAYDQFGFSVAVNHGGYVAAGSPYYDSLAGNSVGIVRIFKTDTSGTASDPLLDIQQSYGTEAYAYYGWSVDINKHLAVGGAPGHDLYDTNSGSIKFILFNSGTETAFTAPFQVDENDYYGYSLDLASDCSDVSVSSGGITSVAFKTKPTGYDMIVGAPGISNTPSGYNYQGKAYISCLTELNPVETFTYRPFFGSSVAIEKQQAVVGAKKSNLRGGVYTYSYTGTFLDRFYSYQSNDYQYFGCDVAYDAITLMMGVYNHPNDDSNGAVYFLDYPLMSVFSSRTSLASGAGYSEETPDAGLRTCLKGNYPNPFNPETSINFSLKEETQASVTVYNMKGQKVKTLVNEFMTSGDHSIVWNGKDDNGSDVSSGVYFYKLTTKNYSQINKMILMK